MLLAHSLMIKIFQKGDVDKIDSVFAQIIQSKLYIQKEKREVEQLEIVKASKQECMDQLDLHRKETVDSLINWHDIDCKILFDATICSKLFSTYGMVHIDSINKVFSSKSKNCKKKPTMTVKKTFRTRSLRLLQFVWRGWEESKQRFSPFPRVATPCNSRISAGPCPACSSCS